MTTTRLQRRRQARMHEAVAMRAKGWSLRDIGVHLGFDHETIRRDLRRWDEAQKVAQFPGANLTKSGENAPPKCDSKVVRMRGQAKL